MMGKNRNTKLKYERKDGSAKQSTAEISPITHMTTDISKGTRHPDLHPDLYIMIPTTSCAAARRSFRCRENGSAKKSMTPAAPITALIRSQTASASEAAPPPIMNPPAFLNICSFVNFLSEAAVRRTRIAARMRNAITEPDVICAGMIVTS